MPIKLVKATSSDAKILHNLQIKSFLPHLEKYQDHATSPACEKIEKTLERINHSSRGFYKIIKGNQIVGGIVIKKTSVDSVWIGPIFVDPDFQNQKIAQTAMKELENLFPNINKFELATLSQEMGNIHLYKKRGYKLLDKKEKINEHLDLVYFEKVKS